MVCDNMKVIVAGDRNWSDEETIFQRLSFLPKGTIIIEGGCRGADRIAFHVADRLRFPVIEMPADWDKYGKAAGPIRNRAMLDLKPDLLIAFHRDLSKSKGTRDIVEEAKKRGIKVEVIQGPVEEDP